MNLINSLLSLFHIFTLWRLRRHIRKTYPNAIDMIMQDQSLGERLGGWPFPNWFNERSHIQWLSITAPQRLPIYILGDDFVIKRVKRLRSSFILAIYAMLDGAVMSLRS